MKTPKEIKKGLEVCGCMYEWDGSCTGCPYERNDGECEGSMETDALAYIRQLENDLQYTTDAANIMKDEALKLESRLAQAEMERDAAVADIEKYKGCGTCKFQDVQNDCDSYQSCCKCDNTDCPCYGASVDDCWQWRGVCPENSKEASPC